MPVNNGIKSLWIWDIAVKDTLLFASTASDGVFLSSDHGANWDSINTGLTSKAITNLIVSGKNVFVGTQDQGVFLSSDNGMNWTTVNDGLPGKYVNTLATYNNNLFLFQNNQIWLSSNNGAHWALASADAYILGVVTIGFSKKNIIVGTYSGEVWIRPLSEVITMAGETTHQIPNQIILAQNYPNPFNPVTTIKYVMPKSGYASLKIFNLVGQQVATIVDELVPSGEHFVSWDATNYPTGMYFYRLQANNYSVSKKLLLLK